MNICRDSEFLNRVVNDPSVFPFVSHGRPHPMDVSIVFQDRRNLFLSNEYGGFLFLFKGDGTYEMHTQFLPEGRGALATEAAHEALAFMFTTAKAVLLTTYVDVSNRKARLFGLKIGFRKVGKLEFNATGFDEMHCSREDWVKKCQ